MIEPTMARPPVALGAASGILFTVPVGVATLKNFLTPAAKHPAVSVSAVPRIWAKLAFTTPEVKSSCPAPVPALSNTLAPISRAV